MFLVAITQHEIVQNFKGLLTDQMQCATRSLTIIRAKASTKLAWTNPGFTLVEAPSSTTKESTLEFIRVTYDAAARTLDIALTPYGGRPLYYHLAANGDFYASTHITLLRDAGIPIEENREAVPELLVYRYVMPPRTLYQNITRLSFGGQLHVKISTDGATIQWRKDFNPQTEPSLTALPDAIEALQVSLLKTIHRLRDQRSDCIALLSGGIDSSILAQLLKKEFSITRTYSTAYPFDSPRLNREKPYAISAAEALGMEHVYYEPSPQEYYRGFIEAIAGAEEPLHHLQSVLLHLLWKNAVKERICLCGQGAGSSFGSNSYFYIRQNRHSLGHRVLLSRPIAKSLPFISTITGSGGEVADILAKPQQPVGLDDPQNPIWTWMEYGSRAWACRYYQISEQQLISHRYKEVRRLPQELYTQWSLYSLFSDEDLTCAIWSKIGEQQGKSVYYPYYDTDVLNTVFSIPWSLKLGTTKDLIRKELSIRNDLPPFIYERAKSSFGLRTRNWATRNGVFEPLVRLATPVIDEPEIRGLQSWDRRKMMTFWNVLNYAIWKRLMINNEPIDALIEELEAA
jgi:asparagine synthase (glutamine-hydrolysing)